MERSSERLLSLDVFRGLTIAGMILVNSPGNQTAYRQLDHSEWNGCTLTDLVFPFFVFIVGVSLVFSLTRRLDRGESVQAIMAKVLRRTLVIFGLGLILNGFPYYDLSTIRILGVLQRIALSYFFAALIFLKLRGWKAQFGIVAALLIGYWLAMTRISVPGFGAGILTREGNLAAYIDRLLLHGHLYRPAYDPEGLLSTLPSVATALLGTLTGLWLLSGRPPSPPPRQDFRLGARHKTGGPASRVAGVAGRLETSPLEGEGVRVRGLIKVQGMVLMGTVALTAGWLWGRWFPINKALWTSPYVLWTGGLALYLLGICCWLIEINGWRRWSKPFEIFGVNAIAAYVLHIVFLKIQNLIHLPQPDGAPGNLRFFITHHLFGWTAPRNASLLYALSYTAFWLAVCWLLYRCRLLVKI